MGFFLKDTCQGWSNLKTAARLSTSNTGAYCLGIKEELFVLMDIKYWINSVINTLGSLLDTKNSVLDAQVHYCANSHWWEHGTIANSIFHCSSILALCLCRSSTRNQRWCGTENSVLLLGQWFHNLPILQRSFWVHSTRCQDTWAVLSHHTLLHVALNYLHVSSTCCNGNIEKVWTIGQDP